MPAVIGVLPGNYRLEISILTSTVTSITPPPKPLYLTNNGEGKQLTVEEETGHSNQEWSIQPPLGENIDSAFRIIVPAQSKDFIASAVSQDVVQHPNEVSLIKNLQVWSFARALPEADNLYEIVSNLYPLILGTVPLLGTDKEVKKVIIEQVLVIEFPEPSKPVWRLLPVKK